jgi:acyl-CoA thioester hydrolase
LKRKFSKTFVVTKAAIDDLNHVNNVVYLQWCMDIAEQHWEERATQSVKDEYVWVALNHYISYKAASFEGDELVIETWKVNVSIKFIDLKTIKS